MKPPFDQVPPINHFGTITKRSIIERLYLQKHITFDEVVILLKEDYKPDHYAGTPPIVVDPNPWTGSPNTGDPLPPNPITICDADKNEGFGSLSLHMETSCFRS